MCDGDVSVAVGVVDEDSVKTIASSRLTPTDFQLLKVIGRGAYGEVKLVSCLHLWLFPKG